MKELADASGYLMDTQTYENALGLTLAGGSAGIVAAELLLFGLGELKGDRKIDSMVEKQIEDPEYDMLEAIQEEKEKALEDLEAENDYKLVANILLNPIDYGEYRELSEREKSFKSKTTGSQGLS